MLCSKQAWGLAVHYTAQVCATVSDDQRLRVWDLAGHVLLAVKKLPKKARAVAYAPDGAALAVGFIDGSLSVLLTADLSEANKVHHRTEEISDIKFSPNVRARVKVFVLNPNLMYAGQVLGRGFTRQFRRHLRHQAAEARRYLQGSIQVCLV
jgi:WD40 repeat protein